MTLHLSAAVCVHFILIVSLYLFARLCLSAFLSFFFNDTATTEIYTLSLHDALPISGGQQHVGGGVVQAVDADRAEDDDRRRSEEHTSELQSHSDLVCRLLLEKKKKKKNT